MKYDRFVWSSEVGFFLFFFMEDEILSSNNLAIKSMTKLKKKTKIKLKRFIIETWTKQI
jgi:hypothetical protein